MSETDCKHQNNEKDKKKNQKWPKLTKCHGKKWKKKTENDTKRIKYMF